jgi:tetratricopeptide (TPR) repeat protein
MTAVKELHQARASEKSAKRSEEQVKSVLNFLKNTLLSAGRPGDVSLTEAFWAGGKGKDLTLRAAVDATRSKVSEAFADQPISEAMVRELLGSAYLGLGDAAEAIKQYQRALALREATQGTSHPDAAACRNQLAVAYRLAGRTDEGGRLYMQQPDSPARADALAVDASILLVQKKPAEAELKLRECLAIRRKIQPDDWTTFDAQSSLGQALADQGKFAEAEPLLTLGYDGLKERAASIPEGERACLARALDRLIGLYDAWGKKDEAAKWRQARQAAP